MRSLPKVSDKPHKVGRLREGSLRAELRARLLDARPTSHATGRQLDWLERMLKYLARVQERSGDAIDRSIPRMAKGLGLPVEGLTVREIRDRFENQITRTLGYLIEMGYVDHVERDLRKPNGEGRCIVVHLRAGVAQSVLAPCKRRSSVKTAPPRRASLRGEMSPLSSVVPKKEVLHTAVGARGAPGTRVRARWAPRVQAAMRQVASVHGVEPMSGELALRDQPVLLEAPVDVVAREAWRLLSRPGRSADCRLSPKRAERFDRACSQLERTGYITVPPGPAAPRAAVIDLALGDWSEHWPRPQPPVTLGGLAVCLRRLAHERVGHQRARRRRLKLSPPAPRAVTRGEDRRRPRLATVPRPRPSGGPGGEGLE